MKFDTFESFFEHIGPKPSARHSLDRINPDGHYEPGNVRWAEGVVQARNKRSSRYLTFNGQTKNLKEWADATGLPYKTIWRRVRDGWPPAEVLSPIKSEAVPAPWKSIGSLTSSAVDSLTSNSRAAE